MRRMKSEWNMKNGVWQSVSEKNEKIQRQDRISEKELRRRPYPWFFTCSFSREA